MTEMVFQPTQIAVRPGARLSAAMREDVAAVARALYDAVKVNGMAADVVAAAADRASPLHDYFTWDDLEAADKERLREAFQLAGSFVDGETGAPVFVSTYRVTNNAADAGRIHVNVRLLPPKEEPITAPRLVYTVGQAQSTPRTPDASYTLHPAVRELSNPTLDADASALPDVIEDPSIAVFRRWVETHKHNPALLREAARILRDAI